MSWRVEYTKTFLKELARLPQPIREQAEVIVFRDLPSRDPFQLGFVEQMKGYQDTYKIRIGQYRLGLTLNKRSRTILCQRIAHRKDIYRIFP